MSGSIKFTLKGWLKKLVLRNICIFLSTLNDSAVQILNQVFVQQKIAELKQFFQLFAVQFSATVVLFRELGFLGEEKMGVQDCFSD